MNPPVGLITPVKAGLGAWLSEFYASFQPDTAANAEWAARGTAKAMSFVPARMVDAVEDMLSSWKVNNNSGAAGTSAFIPVLLVAVAGDYTETPGEAGRPLTDKMPIAFPDDPLGRSFRVRLMGVDLRTQVVVIASDVLSAMSIIGQLCLWAVERRTFTSEFEFSGFTSDWPVQVVPGDRMAVPSPVGEHLSILTLDLTLRATTPLFYGPAGGDLGGEPTDGNDPPGFPVTVAIAEQGHQPTLRGGLSEAEWAAFVRMGGAGVDEGAAPSVVLHGTVDRSTEGA